MALDPKQTPPPSFDDIVKNNPIEVSPYKSAGRSVAFNPESADRYLTYGSKAYGQLGYNPYRDNEKLYVKETPWTKDITRGFYGMTKLAGVGFSDSFAFGAFGSNENHKDFGKIMADFSSSEARGGATKFFANTMLSSGYTVGIIAAVAAEELALAGITALSGGLAAPATGVEMGAAATRAGVLLSKAGKFLSKADDTIGVLRQASDIQGARRWVESAKGFGKALMPLGNTGDFLRLYKPIQEGTELGAKAKRFRELDGLTQTLMGAGALARDARKIYLSHSESKLEADFVKDEIITEEMKKWQSLNPGEEMPKDVHDFIHNKANKAYERTYNNNFGLIYLTNAITFDGLFKGFSPTNNLFKIMDNFKFKNVGFRDVTVEAMSPSVKNFVARKFSKVTWHGGIKGIITSSMEGVQEYGQDVISSAAKKYAGIQYTNLKQLKDYAGKDVFDAQGKPVYESGDIVTGDHADMSRGAYFSQIAQSLGDSSWETFASGALMGIFASPVNLATQAVSEYSFGERGYGSQYNAWTKEGRENYAALYKAREKEAEIMTEFLRKQGSTLTAEIRNPVFEMTGLREKMLEAARNGDQKFFEDNKHQIFQLGMRTMLKNGTYTQVLDHLNSMKDYTADELNQALDRIDITEENKSEFLDKIEKRKQDILDLKKDYDEIERTMPSKGDINKVLRDDRLSIEEKQAAIIDITAWDELKKEMLFTGGKIKNLKERKQAIISKLKQNTKLTDLDAAALTNIYDMREQIELLESQVKSNKEYKLDNTKEHQKVLIKLEALKLMEQGLKKLNNPNFDQTDEKAVDEVYEEMKKGFGMYMLTVNTELNQMPTLESLLSDKNLYNRHARKFDDVFDFYKLDEESQILERYADTLADPQSQSKWLRANKEFLTQLEDNKKEYIKQTIEAFQTRVTSDNIISELLENGIVFELDELDDLFDKQVMPSKLYDVATEQALSPEKYEMAIKIIEKHYKKLTGKKLTGIKKGIRLQTRSKSKTDKRRAATLIEYYAGKGKKGEPIPIAEFVNRLLSVRGSKHLTKTERQILEKLKSLNLLNGNVILTDASDSPITYDEAGNLVIDVRYAGIDYAYADVPFEYLAISALMQNILGEKIKTDEAFSIQVQTLMNDAKQAYINDVKERLARDPESARIEVAKIESMDFFTDPAVFITEAFSNRTFQQFLSQTQNISDVSGTPIWKDVYGSLQAELGVTNIFDNSLLKAALGIATLNLSESVIADVSASPTIEEQGTEVTEEETEEAEEIEEEVETEGEVEEPTPEAELTPEQKSEKVRVLNNQLEKLRKDILGLYQQQNRTKGLTGRMKRRQIAGQIAELQIRAEAIQTEIEKLTPTVETPVNQSAPTVITNPQEKVDQADESGNLIINGSTKFRSLPESLQYELAKLYYRKNKKNAFGGRGNVAVQGTQKEFLDSLSEEDVNDIEVRMLQQIEYKELIGEYNTRQNKPTPAQVEEQDEEDADYYGPVVHTTEAAETLTAVRLEALANVRPIPKDDEDLQGLSGKYYTEFEDHNGENQILSANTEQELINKIIGTYSIDGWANNINNLVGQEIKVQLGDQTHRRETKVLIQAVRLIRQGTYKGHYQIIAQNLEYDHVYDVIVSPGGKITAYTKEVDGKTSTSETKDRLDFMALNYPGFEHYVLPFGSVPPTTAKPTGKKLIIQTVDDLKEAFAGTGELNVFTDEELQAWVDRMALATTPQEFKAIADEFDAEASTRRSSRSVSGKGSKPTLTNVDEIKKDLADKHAELLRDRGGYAGIALDSYVYSEYLIPYAEKYLPSFGTYIEIARLIQGFGPTATVDQNIEQMMANADVFMTTSDPTSKFYKAPYKLNLLDKLRKASPEEIEIFLYLINDLIKDKYIAASKEPGRGEEDIQGEISAIEAITQIAEPFLKPDSTEQPVSGVGPQSLSTIEDETDEDVETEEEQTDKAEMGRTNWNYLAPGKVHIYNGDNATFKKKYEKKPWSIKNRDIEYLRLEHFGSFLVPQDEFIDYVLKWLNNSDTIKRSINGQNLSQKSTVEVEDWVRGQFQKLMADRDLSVDAVNSLNRKLLQAKSDLVIRWKDRAGKSGYVFSTRNKAQEEARKAKAQATAKEVRDYFFPAAGQMAINRDNVLFLVYDLLTRQKMHPDIIKEALSRGEGEIRAYRSLLSKNAKKLSPGGFVHQVLQEYNIPENMAEQDVLAEVLSLGTTLSEIKQYFTDKYLAMLRAQEEENEAKEKEEKLRIAKEKLKAREYEEALKAYYSSEQFAQEVSEFEASPLGQILSGTYKGTRDQLKTESERRAFDEMGYGKEEPGDESGEGTEEDGDFGPTETKLTPIQEKALKFYNDEVAPKSISGSSLQNKFLRDYIKSANVTFEDLAVIYRLIQDNFMAHNPAQNEAIRKIILNQLAVFQTLFYNVSPMNGITVKLSDTSEIPAGIYVVVATNTQTANQLPIGVRNLQTNQDFTILPETLLANVEEVLKPGTVTRDVTLEPSIDSEDAEVAITSIKDIFSNFNTEIDQLDNLEESDLLNRITEKFNQCKK